MHQLDLSEYPDLERAIGITPGTVIELHHLKRGLATAWVSGDSSNPRAVVIQLHDLLEEPFAFGTDAGAIWAILRSIEGWTCVNVDQDNARDLRPIMKWYYPVVRPVEDIYYVLRGVPLAAFASAPPDIETRLLTPSDWALIERSAQPLQGRGFGSPVAMLREGIVAGSIVDDGDGGHLVAIAHTSAFAGQYADVAAYTDEGYRRHGLSSYAAALVMRELAGRGLSAVWSTSEGNRAARRVADKLGLREVSRRVYLIPSTG
ncbi:MAG: GNAT family N-acetyltransferase [Chloroflexota bacterium]|nr:GNAT family N-acetyltransferase [Chloroflexota bacterium]